MIFQQAKQSLTAKPVLAAGHRKQSLGMKTRGEGTITIFRILVSVQNSVWSVVTGETGVFKCCGGQRFCHQIILFFEGIKLN